MPRKEISIKIDEQLFRRLLKNQQYDHTVRAVQLAFEEWKEANDAKLRAAVTAWLDKEMPTILAREMPKMTKGFYLGFDI
jgi:hypothetical protein